MSQKGQSRRSCILRRYFGSSANRWRGEKLGPLSSACSHAAARAVGPQNRHPRRYPTCRFASPHSLTATGSALRRATVGLSCIITVLSLEPGGPRAPGLWWCKHSLSARWMQKEDCNGQCTNPRAATVAREARRWPVRCTCQLGIAQPAMGDGAGRQTGCCCVPTGGAQYPRHLLADRRPAPSM